MDALNNYAENLRQQAPELGVIDADTTLKLNTPEVRVQIDRARAADLGVAIADIANGFRLMVGGDPGSPASAMNRSMTIMMSSFGSPKVIAPTKKPFPAFS